MATPRRPEDFFNPLRPKLLLWLNTAVKLSGHALDRELEALAASRPFVEEMIIRPEDTVRAAAITSKRQAEYQRRMSKLLARRARDGGGKAP